MLPIEENAKRADAEIHYTERPNDSKERKYLEQLIESTILDDILIPIGDQSTETGYFRAMKGLKEFNLTEIRDGCAQEIAIKGRYWIQGRILLAYMNSCSMWYESEDDFLKLLRIKTGRTLIVKNIKLCFGNILMTKFKINVCHGHYEEAKKTYERAREILNKLEQDYRDEEHKIYLIKAGVLQSILMVDAENAMKCSNNQCLADLKKCCELMPNFYYPHFQHAMMNIQMRIHLPSPSKKLEQLQKFRERFPDEIGSLNAIIPFLSEAGQYNEAKSELNDFRRRNPDKMNETWRAEGFLNLGRSSSVEYFKRSILHEPSNLVAYCQLTKYFESVSGEYGKLLEVFNKCLEHVDYDDAFASFFELRQKLLSNIVAENYWNKL